MNVGWFLSKRLLRLGWLLLMLVVLQLVAGPAISQTMQSRTAVLPPVERS